MVLGNGRCLIACECSSWGSNMRERPFLLRRGGGWELSKG